MYTHPGAKLLFMGNEFGQTSEWNYKSELDWELLQYDPHNKLQECVRKLNHLYKSHPALYEFQFDPKGFEWIALNHKYEGVIIYKRKGHLKAGEMLIVLNVTTTSYKDWKLEVAGKAHWKEIFNSNDIAYWGNGEFLNSEVPVTVVDKKRKIYEINLSIPALSAMIFQ